MLRQRFISELEDARKELIRMGEMVESALASAVAGLLESSRPSAEAARALEPQIDAMHRSIHQKCLELVVLEAPVASDARLVTGILESIVDLEQIGDYADSIAELSLGLRQLPPPAVTMSLTSLVARVREMLAAALETWRSLDRECARLVRASQEIVDREYRLLFQQLGDLTTESPDGANPLSLVLIAKYLDRVGRHALNIAEQAAETAPQH
jgi:phosphate transport system protein